jgi:hypothetical protein
MYRLYSATSPFYKRRQVNKKPSRHGRNLGMYFTLYAVVLAIPLLC